MCGMLSFDRKNLIIPYHYASITDIINVKNIQFSSTYIHQQPSPSLSYTLSRVKSSVCVWVFVRVTVSLFIVIEDISAG